MFYRKSVEALVQDISSFTINLSKDFWKVHFKKVQWATLFGSRIWQNFKQMNEMPFSTYRNLWILLFSIQKRLQSLILDLVTILSHLAPWPRLPIWPRLRSQLPLSFVTFPTAPPSSPCTLLHRQAFSQINIHISGSCLDLGVSRTRFTRSLPNNTSTFSIPRAEFTQKWLTSTPSKKTSNDYSRSSGKTPGMGLDMHKHYYEF